MFARVGRHPCLTLVRKFFSLFASVGGDWKTMCELSLSTSVLLDSLWFLFQVFSIFSFSSLSRWMWGDPLTYSLL